MTFNLDFWQQRVRERLSGWRERWQQAGVSSVYTFLSAATLWPVVEAARHGEWAAVAALGTVTASIGSNLLANQIQAWKDEADAARNLEAALPDNPALRVELDAVLAKLETLSLAKAALSEADKAWFAETIQRELAALGSTITYTATLTGDGAVAQGDGAVAVGKGGRYVGGDVNTGGGDFVGRDKIIHQAPDPREIARAEAEDALQRYLERLKKECQILPLAAVGGDETADEDITLDQVYIALDTRRAIYKETLDAIRNGNITRLRDLESVEAAAEREISGVRQLARLPALEAVALAPRAVLLGDPGAGKSTFVKKLLEMQIDALQGGEPVLNIAPDLLPVLVILRDLAPALRDLPLKDAPEDKHAGMLLQALETYLVAEWRRLSRRENTLRLQQALETGKILLALDGLDEVPQDVRPRVRKLVAAVVQDSPAARILVTSRIRSYTGQAVIGDLPTFTLRELTADQIVAFVHAWYNAQAALGRFPKEKADARAEDLRRAALSTDLRELAANPMMLTTMTIIHQKETGLPKERVKLYNLAVDVLVRRWQKRKAGEKLVPSEALQAFLQDDTRLRPALEHLAYEAHRSSQGKREAADLPRGKALTILESKAYTGSTALAAEFLDYVDQRAGLLVGRGGSEDTPATYSFPHRTFQEYLAGCYLAGQRDRTRAFYCHAGEGDLWDLAAVLGAEEMHYNRRSTNELLNLAYALCPPALPSNEKGWRALLWSGQMAAVIGVERVTQDDMPGGGEAYLQRLRRGLAALLGASALAPVERAEAGRVLAKLGDPRFAWFSPRPQGEEPGMKALLPARRWDQERRVWMEEPTLGFVRIPAGPFLMGEGDEQHEVDLPYDYWIARYPVTVAQWRIFVEAVGYNDFNKVALFDLDNHPVRYMTWYNALAYCVWLDGVLKGVSGQVSGGGGETALFWKAIASGRYSVLLPSEAEWEKAARGGLLSPSGRGTRACVGQSRSGESANRLSQIAVPIYPWGDEFDPSKANTAETGIGTTTAVGAFPLGASPYGVLDMSGNVWEWTRSIQKVYPYNPADGREDLQAGAPRVLRGGSFNYDRRSARAIARLSYLPYLRSGLYGFRVVVVPVSGSKP